MFFKLSRSILLSSSMTTDWQVTLVLERLENQYLENIIGSYLKPMLSYISKDIIYV